MNRPVILASLLLLGLLTGYREPKANVSKPKSYRSGSIAFDYPSNWKVTEDPVGPDVQFIFVETPGDALVIVQSEPADGAQRLEVVAREFSRGAEAATPIGKVEGSTFTNLPDADGYAWIQDEFKITVLGESVAHRRLYGQKQVGGKQVLLVLQVATEDFANVETGFGLIRRSLRVVEAEDR